MVKDDCEFLYEGHDFCIHPANACKTCSDCTDKFHKLTIVQIRNRVLNHVFLDDLEKGNIKWQQERDYEQTYEEKDDD